MWIPALVYTVQMNLLYVGYENVQAAIGQITYQSKVLFTALLSVLLLHAKQSPNQWIALLVLVVGVILVQGLDWDAPPPPGKAGQSPLIGTLALLLAALCSAFASV